MYLIQPYTHMNEMPLLYQISNYLSVRVIPAKFNVKGDKKNPDIK